MKKAFTLLEVIISISIFMIVLLFVYKALDQTKYSNKAFASKKENILYLNHLNDIISEDMMERLPSSEKIKMRFDKNKNSIVQFQSGNTYHNIYFNHITYLVGANDKFVRMESKKEFNFGKASYNFFETNNSYTDILLDDVEYFEYNKGVFFIKQKNKNKIIIKTFELR